MKPHHLDRTMGWRVSIAAALALGGLLVAPSDGDALVGGSVLNTSSLSAATPGAATGGTETGATERFIVQSEDGSAVAVGRAAVDLGGRIVATQKSLGTVVVDLPASEVDRLRAVPGVRAVTADSRVTLQSTGVGPTGLPGDLTNVARLTGATTLWRNGFSGQGVDVALLDSGIVPVEGLTTANKVVIGPDLSSEAGQRNLAGLDTFGHGTHMAGIIAGRDPGTSPGTYADDNINYLGMAPDARIVSIKLADARGNTDISQVIAAIDWVITHAHDSGLNIRVLNLSFGTDVTQDYRLDPLARAAEVAWDSGIVVVVSAGNGDGTSSGLANPAYDPAVLSVGAVDTQGTINRFDDRVPAFSQRGAVRQGMRAPDVVAPGTSIVGLRAKGSFVDSRYAATGAVGERFFKGSGTSQSAAVVSGAAALLLSERPWLTPDQVKDVLRRSARWVYGSSYDAQGTGSLDLAGASFRARRYVQRSGLPTGGGGAVTAPTTGEGSWSGSPLLGATWAGDHWEGATWAGATWAGATWADEEWAGATWAGATWAGATWAGATWAGATWADEEWANDLWSSAAWE